jgi:hypothetical protein
MFSVFQGGYNEVLRRLDPPDKLDDDINLRVIKELLRVSGEQS